MFWNKKDNRNNEQLAETTFLSHLYELRDRLLRVVVILLLAFLALFPWANDIYDFLAAPMMAVLPIGTKMIATGVITPFFVPVKVTFWVAFLVTLPLTLYQIWGFIAPALYRNEKRFALPLLATSVILFFLGMAFCYLVVFKTVFGFIASVAPKSITPAPDIEAYFDFVTGMFLAFGGAFETPVVVVLLVMTGLVSLDKLRYARPYVTVGAFVVAAIVTPPDVLSQLLLAIPLVILYELGILFCRIFGLGVADKQKETNEQSSA